MYNNLSTREQAKLDVMILAFMDWHHDGKGKEIDNRILYPVLFHQYVEKHFNMPFEPGLIQKRYDEILEWGLKDWTDFGWETIAEKHGLISTVQIRMCELFVTYRDEYHIDFWMWAERELEDRRIGFVHAPVDSTDMLILNYDPMPNAWVSENVQVSVEIIVRKMLGDDLVFVEFNEEGRLAMLTLKEGKDILLRNLAPSLGDRMSRIYLYQQFNLNHEDE